MESALFQVEVWGLGSRNILPPRLVPTVPGPWGMWKTLVGGIRVMSLVDKIIKAIYRKRLAAGSTRLAVGDHKSIRRTAQLWTRITCLVSVDAFAGPAIHCMELQCNKQILAVLSSFCKTLGGGGREVRGSGKLRADFKDVENPVTPSFPLTELPLMAESLQSPWSDNSNAPQIPYLWYYGEKSGFAGSLVLAILYGIYAEPLVRLLSTLFDATLYVLSKSGTVVA